MLLLFFCFTATAQGLLVLSTDGGLWSDALSWEGGVLPIPGDDVVIMPSCNLTVDIVLALDDAVTVKSVTLVPFGTCRPSLVIRSTGRLQTTLFNATTRSFVFLDGGTLVGSTLLIEGASLGGAGRITGAVVVTNSDIVPGVSPLYVESCWPGYPTEPKSGDLVFSDLELAGGSAVISANTSENQYLPRIFPDASVSSIIATTLTVAMNTTLEIFLADNGPFLRWTTLLLYGSLMRIVRVPLIDCSGTKNSGNSQVTTKPSLAGDLCPTALGVLSFVQEQCSSSCSCSSSETCDTSSGLCRLPSPMLSQVGTASLNSTATTAAAGGGVETWVILVAVLVPVAVLTAVAAVLLIRYMHLRSEAASTEKMNRDLRDHEMGKF